KCKDYGGWPPPLFQRECTPQQDDETVGATSADGEAPVVELPVNQVLAIAAAEDKNAARNSAVEVRDTSPVAGEAIVVHAKDACMTRMHFSMTATKPRKPRQQEIEVPSMRVGHPL
ncbi:hypothetical protein MRX96_045257, partial [Rhipicephalus microplus]